MQDTKDAVVWVGKIGGIVDYTPVNEPTKRFHRFSRPPGTRTIVISSDDKLLLTKDFRQEKKDYDFRLPGGKVFDSFDEFQKFKDNGGNISEEAAIGCLREIEEEAGIEGKDPVLFNVSTSGGPTVEWDLYYFVVKDYKILNEQKLGDGEDITFDWYSIPEVLNMCFENKIQEDRSVANILKYLHSAGKITVK